MVILWSSTTICSCDPSLLDTVAIVGGRFDRMIEKLMTA